VTAKGIVKGSPVTDVLVDASEDGFEAFVLGLILQHLQNGEHGYAGADKSFKLLGEQYQFGRLNRRKQTGGRRGAAG
jgi:hypothetical protein